MRKLFELLRRAIVLATLFPIVLGGMVGCAESGTGIVKVELENSDTGKMHTPWRPVSTKSFDFREPPSLPQKNQGFKHMLGEHVAVLREESKKAVGVQWDPPGDIPPLFLGIEMHQLSSLNRLLPGDVGAYNVWTPQAEYKYYGLPSTKPDHNGVFLRFTW